jgi:hypothetical protein
VTCSTTCCGIEETIKGLPPDHRRERQERSKPLAAALTVWADETVLKLSRKSELAAAFRYMRARWAALIRCFDDGRLAFAWPSTLSPNAHAAIRSSYAFARLAIDFPKRSRVLYLSVGCRLRFDKTKLADKGHYQSNDEDGPHDDHALFVDRPRRKRSRD